MKSYYKKLSNYFFFLLFRVRPFTRKIGKEIAQNVKFGTDILEVGSGWQESDGRYYFSQSQYFKNKSVNFIMSDKNESFGHKVVDIAQFEEKEKYDQILCFHVLDDVYEWEKALLNLYNALKEGGTLHLVVPGFSPLDIEADKYRFTDKLFKEFSKRNAIDIQEIRTHGFEIFPFAYYVKFNKK